MKLLEEAGIYVFAVSVYPSLRFLYIELTIHVSIKGVTTPKNCISRVDPESYNPDNMTSFFKRVDTMARFPNTLGLLVSSELINSDETMPIAAILKAVVRDLKKYMKIQNGAHGQRVLPLGYQAATAQVRDQEVLEYLTAVGGESSLDFWAVSDL
jgi:hypothetical protein